MIDATQPVAGYYRMKLVRGGPFVGIRIWHGAPREPWTGDIMDRAPCWNAQANGEWIDFERVWPVCTADPIDEATYRELCALKRDALAAGDAYSAFATPKKAVDWSTATPPSFA